MPSKKESKKSRVSGASLLTFCLISILILTFSIFNLKTFFLPKKVTQDINIYFDQEKFWISVVGRYPDYIDGWLELAKLNFKLNDLDEARKAFEKALAINPNSEKIAELGRSF